MARTHRQKAIQGLLSRFRWSPGPSIFDGFLANLNRALSALFFSNSDLKKSKIPPPQGVPLGGQRGVLAPLGADPAFMPSIVEKQLETTMAHRSRASEFLDRVERHADLRKKKMRRFAPQFLSSDWSASRLGQECLMLSRL